MRRHLAAVTAALAALLAAAPAQQRRPLVGRVVDATGAGVAAAHVTLVWSPPGGAECGPNDVVTTSTDDRGRFIAKLLPQEGYSALAVGVIGGATRTSSIREGAAAGGDLVLTLEHAAERRQITLLGADAWTDVWPLHLEVAANGANVASFPVGEDGLSPPMPPGSVALAFVRDFAGRVLFVQSLPRRSGPVVVQLPPPRPWRLRVVDANKAPIANATVHHAACACGVPLLTPDVMFQRPIVQWWRHAGTTGEDGTVLVQALREPDRGWWPLLVRAPGYAETVLASVPPERNTVRGSLLGADPQGVHQIVLSRASRLRVLREGRPVTGAEAMLTANVLLVPLQRSLILRLDAKGECDVPLPLESVETMLHLRLQPDAPWQLLRIPIALGKTAVIDLAHQRRLSLQFLDGQGGPRRGMTGVLVAVGSMHATSQQIVVSTDQAGRLERTLGGDAWLLIMADKEGWVRFDVPRAADQRADIVSTVQCEPFARLRYRVTDPAGKPIAGARATEVTASPAIPRGDPATGLLLNVLGPLANRVAAEAASDAAGLLSVPVLTLDNRSGRVTIEAPGFAPQRHLFAAPDDESVVEVTLQPGAAAAIGR